MCLYLNTNMTSLTSPPVAGYVGLYTGAGWAPTSGGGWKNEATPGTNDITATSGTLATAIDPASGYSYTYGGTTATLTLPFVPATGSSPYTFFHVARYNGAAKQRIFQGRTQNWLSGFHQASTGVAYHNNWLTADTSTTEFDQTTWLVSTDRPTNYRANRLNKTVTSVTGTLTDQIVVNTGAVADQTSDWAIAEMIYYPTTLSDADVKAVEAYLFRKYITASTPPVAGYIGWYIGDGWAAGASGGWINEATPGANDITATGTVATAIDAFTGAKYAYGGTTATLTLPFVPATGASPYTFFHVARYNGAAKQRIFQGKTINWLSGYFGYNGGADTGVAHHDTWLTATSSTEFDVGKWLLCADRPTDFRANMVNKTINTVSGLIGQIVVNTGMYPGEASDWAISEMIYYDRTLSDTEVIAVESYLNTKYKVAATTTLPASGSISLSSVRSTFPGVKGPGALLSYIGVHPSAPTGGGPVSLTAFRGLNAVTPTHAPVTLYDTGASGTAKATAALTASGLAVSTAGGGTLPLTLNLASYLTNTAYQGGVTYSVSNGRAALPTGVTLNAATGVLSVDPATVNTGTSALAYTATIIATNKWGNASVLAVTFNFAKTGISYVVSKIANFQSSSTSAFIGDGILYMYGYNEDGLIINSSVPVSLASFGLLAGKTITSASISSGQCYALTSTGTVYAWGNNSQFYGGGGSALGINVTNGLYVDQKTLPVLLSFGSLVGKTVTAVSCGSLHHLALDSTGKLHVWGQNSNWVYGNNTGVNSSVPVAISTFGTLNGKTVIDVSAGLDFTLALDSTGQVHGWGLNGYGPLGNNNATYVFVKIPILISTFGSLVGKTITKLACGPMNSMALDSTGKVHTWGQNPAGQLGNNSVTQANIPVAVSNIIGSSLVGKTITAICWGGGFNSNHAIALDSAGQVHTWGLNDFGQLGNNSAINSKVPLNISSFGSLVGKTVVAIRGGGSHTLALDSTGKMHAWGKNELGQLGIGTTANSSIPVQM